MNTPQKPKTGALDIRDEDVARFETDRELKARDGEIYPDESMSLRARRQAARQHEDAFIVATDLEDDDQREAAPGSSHRPKMEKAGQSPPLFRKFQEIYRRTETIALRLKFDTCTRPDWLPPRI